MKKITTPTLAAKDISAWIAVPIDGTDEHYLGGVDVQYDVMVSLTGLDGTGSDTTISVEGGAAIVGESIISSLGVQNFVLPQGRTFATVRYLGLFTSSESLPRLKVFIKSDNAGDSSGVTVGAVLYQTDPTDLNGRVDVGQVLSSTPITQSTMEDIVLDNGNKGYIHSS